MEHHPSVLQLKVHLPDQHTVRFRECQQQDAAMYPTLYLDFQNGLWVAKHTQLQNICYMPSCQDTFAVIGHQKSGH